MDSLFKTWAQMSIEENAFSALQKLRVQGRGQELPKESLDTWYRLDFLSWDILHSARTPGGTTGDFFADVLFQILCFAPITMESGAFDSTLDRVAASEIESRLTITSPKIEIRKWTEYDSVTNPTPELVGSVQVDLQSQTEFTEDTYNVTAMTFMGDIVAA